MASVCGSLVYQEELRRRLTERLGVEWGPDRNGCREIEGFENGWLRTFSKRTVAIEEHLAGAGPEDPDPATRMRANDAASLATRPAKDGSFTPESLRARWQAEADEIGLPTGYALAAQVCDRVLVELRPPLEWDAVVDTLVDAEEGLCARRARFNEAHVVECIAALGAGDLDVAEIEALAGDFLDSGEAVPLVSGAGRLPEYSTVTHLEMGERVLVHLSDLVAIQVSGIDPVLVDPALKQEGPGFGPDQAEAVRALCAPGPALRTVIAPAGFGKTTTVHGAALAARCAGHPVVGLAATNQAAGELRQAGIPAMTIARFALDGGRLAPGAVVVLDEVSQVATADAEVVLAAVAATPGARLWCLGDPHQAQSVRAGGLGAELARLAACERIPAPVLTENRRQLAAAEREALARYRRGEVVASQAIRNRHGWEHDLGSPHATREALADAVAADVATHGRNAVVALAVSHADCEDLADRIRSRLRAGEVLAGPEMAGAAWIHGERSYAAGDRVLVHGRLHTDGQRLHNGSVLTVTAVAPAGLHATDDHGHAVVLPSAFVEGRRGDGSPNLSHAWARTVDGIQGGTWTQVHLLGTAALERFTGYVGQSRSRYATHTWNVSRLADLDHGGLLADPRTPEREVLDALRRVPETGFAAHDSPGRIRRLLDEQAEHEAVLAGAPPDRRRELDRAEDELRSAEREHHWAKHRLDAAHARLVGIGPLSLLRRRGRQERSATQEDIERFQGGVARAAEKVAGCRQGRDQLSREVAQGVAWHAEHDWRHGRLAAIGTELAALGHIDLRRIPLPERSSGLERDRSRTSGLASSLGRLPRGDEVSARWADRLAEIAAPPLPGPGDGLGMDLGL